MFAPMVISAATLKACAKMAVKLVLRAARIPYHVLSKLGVNRHGNMDSYAYARQVFDRSIQYAPSEARTILELGPGDSVLTALFASERDMKATLVDVGDFAVKDAGFYGRALGSAPCSQDEFLSRTGGSYFVCGIESLRGLPDQSFDFVFSNAVLEHVRLADVDILLAETKRLLKPGGRFFHEIDLRDHLVGGLENLRFPVRFWECDFIASAGFYTNRIPVSEWVRRLQTLFDLEGCERVPFDHVPNVRRVVLTRRGWEGDDARVKVCRIVGRAGDPNEYADLQSMPREDQKN